MKGERSLVEQPFRYGGFLHDFGKKTKDLIFENGSCYCCGRDLSDLLPYAAFYEIKKEKSPRRYHLKLICRKCAYAYGRGVVERNGNIYQDEQQYFEDENDRMTGGGEAKG